MRALLLAAMIAPAAASSDLGAEALVFLDRLASTGYGGIFMAPLEVSILEPCTLDVMMNPLADRGFFMAIGGENVLDLSLVVEGNGWSVSDSFPDDFPVLELDAPLAATVRRMIVCATDMIHNADRDSVVVMYAVSVVDLPEPADDVPAEQDSTGVQ
ncbi:MAG: hypothetical protein QUS11_03110 [Candidatus Fermentibacter sp.]|nr:hypothetical protein [Candidatus Fermentibacter sp.]